MTNLQSFLLGLFIPALLFGLPVLAKAVLKVVEAVREE